MRRLLLTGSLLCAVPAIALGGARVTEGTNTMRIKTAFDPARAGEPVEVKYDYWTGTTDGSRLPDLRSAKIFLGGARASFDAFPKCDETDARNRGARVCPRGSKVGKGTAVAEIHLADRKEDLKVRLSAYNGRLDTDRNGRPMKPRDGLLLHAKVEGAIVAFGFWAERGNTRLAYYNPKRDPDPEAESFFAIKEIHLTVPRRIARRGGRRIPFVAAPSKCRQRWVVTTTNVPYQGEPLTAKHAVRCRPAT